MTTSNAVSDKCKKHCNVFWKKCTLNKCGHNSKGWCCKPWKITRDECDRHCIGRWKYCTDRGCSKDYIGYCCKSQPYITKNVQYCKHAGDSCGYKGGKVCQRCSKAKLCCRPGVTMGKTKF
ncbi:hypothetical protein FJT64_004222 [Amphibalanus amphitrite]|uniref:Uncharacterized protein n=1 Tax=Amphibalanus amphitrite TaxID=1232801 RepID=A0A6A4VZS7_AMPAM|nr:hypothetical protein FJT64_004222 [Amphibalanus amphitrite]